MLHWDTCVSKNVYCNPKISRMSGKRPPDCGIAGFVSNLLRKVEKQIFTAKHFCSGFSWDIIVFLVNFLGLIQLKLIYIQFLQKTCTIFGKRLHPPIAVTAVKNILCSGREEGVCFQINPPSTQIWYSSNWIAPLPLPPHSNGHSGALYFWTDLSNFVKSLFRWW